MFDQINSSSWLLRVGLSCIASTKRKGSSCGRRAAASEEKHPEVTMHFGYMPGYFVMWMI